MVSKEEVGKRIRAARERLGLSQKDFALHANMPLPSLKDYEGGKRMPGGEAIASFCDAGINATWLLTGDGPELLEDLSRARKTVEELSNRERIEEIRRLLAGLEETAPETLTPEERKWLEWYRQMEPGDRRLASTIAAGFAAKGQNRESEAG